MAKISRRGTKPEVLVRIFLFANGFRYRLNVSSLAGKPDILLRKFKAVIFVNGCFLAWAYRLQESRIVENKHSLLEK